MLTPVTRLMHAFFFFNVEALLWEVLKYVLVYVLVYSMNFIYKSMFLKVPHQKRLLCHYVQFQFLYEYITLSLFPGRAFIYMVSIFSQLLALGITFPLLQNGLFWSISRALHCHKLCCWEWITRMLCAGGSLWVWSCGCVCILMSTQCQTGLQIFNSEGCVHKAAFVNSLVNGFRLGELKGWFNLRPLTRIFFF